MHGIDFEKCSAEQIRDYLIVLRTAVVEDKKSREEHSRITLECMALQDELMRLENGAENCAEKQASIEKSSEEYVNALIKASLENNKMRDRNLFKLVKKKYGGIIDEKYWYDGTLDKVIELFLSGEVTTVKQALEKLNIRQ